MDGGWIVAGGALLAAFYFLTPLDRMRGADAKLWLLVLAVLAGAGLLMTVVGY